MVAITRPGSKKDEVVEYYMDDHLEAELERIREKVLENDEDYFISVDGGEGAGKSVFAMQIAKYLDPDFNIDRVVFNANEFKEAILKAKKGQCVLFDEAFRGLSSRSTLTEVNKLLVALMMECRQKNLFVIVVMPSFFLLDKYVALWRAKGLFHVYRPKSGDYKGKRGFWLFFNSEKKKLLYLIGKATYSYSKPQCSFQGRFLGKYAIDKDTYLAKKAAAFQSTPVDDKKSKADKFISQRDLLLWFLNREMKITTTALSHRLEEFGLDLAHNTISEAVVKKEEELKEKGYLL